MKIEDEIQQQKFRNAQQKAVINLLYTSSWLLGKQQEFFKSFNITPQQFNILRILKGQLPASTSATEIKSRMLDKNSDVSRLLDRLVAKQFITRRICEKDKRSADVCLTETGICLLREIDKRQLQLDTLLLLNDEEAHWLSDMLDKIRG
jgi:DNA-binding MarR family transcriptional regulator